MAKNKGHRKPIQVQPSFFVQQKQKYGEDFMHYMNAEIIRRNALKIFKDLASGAINPITDSIYFNDYNFTYNLKLAAEDNARYNWACYVGLSNYPGIMVEQDLYQISLEHYEQFTTYRFIESHLNNMLQNITMGSIDYTVQLLEQLINQIRWKRRLFNGYFITIPRDEDKKPRRREFPNESRGFNNQSEDDGFFDPRRRR